MHPDIDRTYRIAPKANKIVLEKHPDVAQLMPFEMHGDRWMILDYDVDQTTVLRNLGYGVPSPILTQYDWAGSTPFESQTTTAAMLTMCRRGYVLSEMGTGKTRAALFAFDYLRKVGAAHKMIVVAPLSTLTVVWLREAFNSFPHLTVSVVHGTRKQRVKALEEPADIYIINHDGVKVFCDKSFNLQPELARRHDIDVVLFDELAVYRNRRTDRWKAAAALLKGRKYGWGMTGGPTPKEPTDAWAQVRLLTPENVSWSFKAFREEVMYQFNQFKWLPRKNATERVHLDKVLQRPFYQIADREFGHQHIVG